MASVYDDPRTDDGAAARPALSELVSNALRQFSGLMRTEMALARAEISNKAVQAMRGGAMLGVAAVVALPALFVLMLALAAFMVEMGVAVSLACLITGIIGLVAAGILARLGLNRLRADALIPNRTINQLQRDAAAAKEHI